MRGAGQISSGLRRFPCLPHLTCLPPALVADGICVTFLGLPTLGHSPPCGDRSQLEMSSRLGHQAGSGAQRSLKSVVDCAGDKTRHKQKHPSCSCLVFIQIVVFAQF